MTARPDAPELTTAELRFLDRPDEPESLRFRVAEAILESWYPDGGSPARVFMHPEDWAQFQAAADAALAVVRGEK